MRNNTIRRMIEELREFERNERNYDSNTTPVLVRGKSRVNAFFRETSDFGKLLDLSCGSNSKLLHALTRGTKIDGLILIH